VHGVIGFAALLLSGLLLALVAAVVFTIHRLRNPPRRTYSTAVARGLPGDPSELDTPREFKSWSISADIGRANGSTTVECPVWETSGDDPNGPIAILTPGWGDSRVGGLLRISALAPHCSRLLLWDPPGQGEAPGRCRLGTAEDEVIAALLDRSLTHDAHEGAILYGWSLGAGTSIVAGARADLRARIAGVIAEGVYRLPWTPAKAVLHEAGYPWRLNIPIAYVLLGLRLGQGPRWRSFDRAEHAARLECPLLCLHGEQDRICPIDDARAVADSAPLGRLVTVRATGHNDMWTVPEHAQAARDAVGAFMRQMRTPDQHAAFYG